MWREYFFAFFLCLLGLSELISAICPQMCICDIDELGRKRTRCEGGGVSIPGNLDLNSLDQDTEVLIVTGSRQRPNTFSLNPNMFQNKRFKEIHLSFSQMDWIGDRTFSYISSSLLVLNLTHNDLRTMSENNFRNLTRLTHLHVDYNRIASVHSAMFSYLTSLKVLTISHNLINDVPQRMGLQLTKLEVLDMSNNPIGVPVIENVKQTIPDIFFQDFPNLRVLNLANTSLDSLPWSAIQKSNLKLEQLDMSNNKIQDIQQNQLSLIRDLKRVRLASNPIRSIAPGALIGLSLENLDLSGLPAQNILQRGVFQGVRIQRLDLSYTGLTALNQEIFLPISQELIGLNVSGNTALVIEPQMFMALPELRMLSMGRLRKTALPGDLFSHGNKLAYLDLSEIGLVDLDDAFFSHLTNLETLILAGNQLQRIPLTVSLPKIAEIDLSRNQLKNFPDNLVNAFAAPASALKSFKLNNNPWNCDCGVASLGRWLVSHYGNQGYPTVCIGNGNFTCPSCYEPAGLRGTPLNMLPPQFLDTCTPADVKVSGPNANIDVIIAVVVCLIVLIIAILLLVLWYRNRLHSYRTYEEKRKDGDTFEHNGDVTDVFEDAPPISKPKNGLPASVIHVAPPVAALPKQESNV